MPELSDAQIRWMRNRFVEMIQRAEVLSEELTLIRDELTQVVDALAAMLPPSEAEGGGGL